MSSVIILKSGNKRSNTKYVNVRRVTMNVTLDSLEWEILSVNQIIVVITTSLGSRRMINVLMVMSRLLRAIGNII